ncbi:Sporulation protein RMD1 [Neochlamydia sp. EPS4]|uniref:RMD1 family protein n=1 Tax=unclassified Neochlamydia TaxID=2643326 RepID=UPI000583ABC6|nr:MULTISPECIES: RMD1 family protein [unclassified Neochlamydia]KIC75314.1 Sporulation protein RMD1 [Neochlamydia sp. EPS4]BBI16201.1 Putative uncharacterized protein [Neochlamydia sp. S13]
MDCRAYCTAASYKIKLFYEILRQRFPSASYRDAVHCSIPLPHLPPGDVFFFSYGAVVCWGLPKEIESEMLKLVQPYEEKHSDDIETDEFTYLYGEAPRILEDEIILPNQEMLTKLAISHGLAQSVKLGTFENAIQATFNQSKHIPEDLASKGKISYSKKAIRKKMGELFIARNSINLHADVLDTPEFFWEYPELEPLYTMVANYLDIESRVEVLNQRLDVVHELFQMLGSELNHQHSSRLEWTIIWLIIIEVMLNLLKDVFRIL